MSLFWSCCWGKYITDPNELSTTRFQTKTDLDMDGKLTAIRTVIKRNYLKQQALQPYSMRPPNKTELTTQYIPLYEYRNGRLADVGESIEMIFTDP